MSFYTDTAADIFPKSAKMLDDSKLTFFEARKALHLVDCWHWGHHKGKVKAASSMFSANWCKLFLFIEDCLFLEWSQMTNEVEYLPIIIPQDDLVQPYAEAVGYYTISWILQRCYLALTVAKKKRHQYQDFALCHNLSKNDAKELGLPTKIVDRQEHHSLYQALLEFHKFMKIVESTYIKNFTLKNMLGYVNGSLIEAIERTLIQDEGLQEKFFAL